MIKTAPSGQPILMMLVADSFVANSWGAKAATRMNVK
jgi:hypothetical protein